MPRWKDHSKRYLNEYPRYRLNRSTGHSNIPVSLRAMVIIAVVKLIKPSSSGHFADCSIVRCAFGVVKRWSVCVDRILIVITSLPWLLLVWCIVPVVFLSVPALSSLGYNWFPLEFFTFRQLLDYCWPTEGTNAYSSTIVCHGSIYFFSLSLSFFVR